MNTDGNDAVHIAKINVALTLASEVIIQDFPDLAAVRNAAIAYLLNEFKPAVVPAPAPTHTATRTK